MSKYKGLFTFDEDNHRYVPIAQADGIIDTMDYEPITSEVKGPLIETADARYIVKLWASTNLIPSNSNEIEVCLIDSQKGTITQFYSDGLYIQFFGRVAPDAIHGRCYTIDELCGEEEE